VSDDIRREAEALTENLFTNGSGARADRLVLTIDGPPTRDLGGWCRGAVIDQLEAFGRRCAERTVQKPSAGARRRRV
jgi:hypothetical protein